jgi:hypothetical protein
MGNRVLSTLVLAAALGIGACGGGADEAESTSADTMTVPGTDVVDVPTTVPTQDTVVRTTTTETDTIRGEVDADTVGRDTAPRP